MKKGKMREEDEDETRGRRERDYHDASYTPRKRLYNSTMETQWHPSYLSIPVLDFPSPRLRPLCSPPLSDPPAHLETLHKYNYCSIRGRVVLGYLSLWVNEFPPSAPIYWLILLGLGRCASK